MRRSTGLRTDNKCCWRRIARGWTSLRIPTAGITAWHALFSVAGLKAGETVLIHAGAGGVGSFAVQFAHKAGARVIATASGDGMALARSLGADEVIDYETQDFTAAISGVDVVLDLVEIGRASCRERV